ncbi:hypothetical protein BDR05DRAFT_945656 [Suillus weaverae]|nr:hypothetical protein BDR05DRAFT_945656 [Suillus weaverae]
MSDIPPPKSMIPPGTSLSYPELCYNDASNAFVCDNVGAWVPHPGICNALTSRQSFRMESGTYALSPAKFTSVADSPSPSTSCIVICQVPSNNIIDPVLLPLPDSGNLDLTDAVTIVEAHGHIPAAKMAGSRCKAKAPRAKSKGKENVLSTIPKKCLQEDGDNNDDAQVRRGRPQGSNNYTNLDVNALLDMVQDELPLGQRGWQTVHLKYCQ